MISIAIQQMVLGKPPSNKIWRWLGSFIWILLLFLFVSPANGQALNISPEWKSHFTSTPIIENCVFEYDDKRNGETHLYQFRWQSNAFLFRQIGSLAEASSNH